MERNMSEAGAAGEAGAEEYDDGVFVPHYGNYVHAATPTRNGHQPQQGSFFVAPSIFLRIPIKLVQRKVS
jgi:hypothetical protein